jgi:type VI secretion system protein ImpK
MNRHSTSPVSSQCGPAHKCLASGCCAPRAGATNGCNKRRRVTTRRVAFCATVDEIILKSQFKVRDSWELRPLQLTMFGEQLAGETFFVKLEELRAKGAKHVQALEVYYMCLLLGFQGKYMIDGSEKLRYLTARLGDEIASMKGKRAPFAPHWSRPDKVSHQLKTETPLWVISSVFALLGLVAYLGLSSWSTKSTKGLLGGYEDIVKLAPRAANISITLP